MAKPSSESQPEQPGRNGDHTNPTNHADQPPTPVQLGDFSTHAKAYALSRPSYPPNLLRQLMRIAQIKQGQHVADIGAGTGIFSEQLLAQGLRVHAIEPNAAMRNMSRPLPGLSWHDGSFNAIPLPDDSVHWVTAAQAFHWADPKTALPEMARILAPKGSLTVLWNRRLNQQNPITQWTIHAIQKHVPDFQDLYQQTVWTQPLQSTGHFHNVTYLQEPHFIPMSAQRYLDLWRSHNHLAVSAGPAKLNAFLKELTDYLNQHHIQTINVPYSCQSWTAQKID